MDNKILLIAALALVAVAAIFVVLAPQPGRQGIQAANVATAPLGTEGSASTAVVSAGQDVQAKLASETNQAVGSQTSSDVVPASAAPPSHYIVASYFHNTTRCATCLNIEQLARVTVETRFPAEMAAGKLVWRSLNMEEKQYEHYAIDYSLTSSSLVLTEMEGDREVRFKVLTETWNLIHKRLQFEPYIENETRAFLEGL